MVSPACIDPQVIFIFQICDLRRIFPTSIDVALHIFKSLCVLTMSHYESSTRKKQTNLLFLLVSSYFLIKNTLSLFKAAASHLCEFSCGVSSYDHL